jgi:DNA-binding transcriptional ArsR family regulator
MSASLEPELARVASMIGVPARAAMLSALLGGRPMRAGELARAGEVAPSTASEHLSQLTASGLVACHASGRNRYYALASDEVAAALEALSLISAPRVETDPANPQFKFARTCYDHLAGELGVALAETLIERGFIDRGSGYELTQSGEQWLDSFGIDSAALRRQRRTLVRACLDWSERRHHLAGAVGAAMLAAMLECRWVARIESTRALRLTVRGRDGLYRALGLDLVT